MDNSKELAIKELLFYSECELQSMIAENQNRAHRGESPAYVENGFLNLAERTRDAYLRISN